MISYDQTDSNALLIVFGRLSLGRNMLRRTCFPVVMIARASPTFHDGQSALLSNPAPHPVERLVRSNRLPWQ
jgi:hypothetical protein